MGETAVFQPLTREDRITVLLYRTGIVLSTIFLVAGAVLAIPATGTPDMPGTRPALFGLAANVLLLSLYFSSGLNVFFIHLYIGKFHRVLKKIYYGAVVCVALLFLTGKGNPASALFSTTPVSALLLIPLSCCLGFVAAKEAFCFRLLEGYLLALVMPAYLFAYGTGLLDRRQAAYGLAFIAVLHLFFMFRKAFMPLHYDIGDKSAYQP